MDQRTDAGQAMRKFLQGAMKAARPTSMEEAIALRNSLLIEAEAVFTELLAAFAPLEGPFRIGAEDVIVELVDGATGQLYRRPLELHYEESENGIVLCGEDMAGQPVSIVYLSDAYMQRLVDISGQGPEEDHCH